MQKGNVTGSSGKKGLAKREVEENKTRRSEDQKIKRSKDAKIQKGPKGPKNLKAKIKGTLGVKQDRENK
jgi:hypothetical protein